MYNYSISALEGVVSLSEKLVLEFPNKMNDKVSR